MTSSTTLDAASFEVIGTFTDEHYDILAELLIALDAESDHPATAPPEANGDNPTGNQE